MSRSQSVGEFQESNSAPPPTAARDRYTSGMKLGELRESPMNPRKRFDAAGLEELTASIREKGVLTPLLARPVPGWNVAPYPPGRHYEIASGHRRFRAAKAAGLEEVPVVLREMTDPELLEVLVVENNQREDVHPLEEAAGYQALMKSAGYDVARIAARVGRSAKYVYDRIKLLALTKEAQQLFLDGKFTAGHAILLARLKPEDQKRALNRESGRFGRLSGLFEEARELPFDDEAFEKAVEKDPYLAMKPISVREFESWIQDRVKFDRDQIDPVLFPETAATLAAARAGKQKVISITRDYRAGDEVRAAGKERVFGDEAWERADGKEDSKTCDRARVALVVCGPGQGEAFLACIDKERCAVHWSAWQRERKKRQAALAKGGGAAQRVKDDWKARQEKQREEQAQRDAEQKRWEKARPSILEALAAAVKKAPATAGGEMARLILKRCQDNYHARNLPHEKYMPKGRTAEDLVRFAAFVVLCDQLLEWTAPQEFPKRARAVGVDVRKIVDQVAPPEKVQTAAEPAKAKKGGRR